MSIKNNNHIEISNLKGNILLASNSLEMQSTIQGHIKATEICITIADSLDSAFELSLSKNIQIILLDAQLSSELTPTIELLRAAGYMRAIVVILDSNYLDNTPSYMEVGANQCLSLSDSSHEFDLMLNQHLESSVQSKDVLSDKMQKKMAKMSKLFLSSLPEKINHIQDAYKKEDWENLDAISHKLKGIGGSMGYPKITTLAQSINTLTRNKNFDECKLTINQLVEYSNKILN